MLLPSGIWRRVVLQAVTDAVENPAVNLSLMEDCGRLLAAACQSSVISCHTRLCIAQDNTK